MNSLLQQIAMSLPGIVATIAGLVMTSIYRQRSPAAANLAMWCLIAYLANIIGGALFFSLLVPVVANFGGLDRQLVFMAIGFARTIVSSAAILGLVYAVFMDRKSELEDLPELDDRSSRL